MKKVIYPDNTPIALLKSNAESMGCELKRIDRDTLIVKPKKDLGDNVRVLRRPTFDGDDNGPRAA